MHGTSHVIIQYRILTSPLTFLASNSNAFGAVELKDIEISAESAGMLTPSYSANPAP